MSERNILLLEYLNLSDIQKKFYFPSVSDDGENTEEEIESRFFYKPKKISWSSSIQLPLLLQKEGHNYVYIADENFHMLNWTCLIWKIPRISVKEEYKDKIQICWVKNLAISIVKEASLYVGDKKIQNIDTFFYCIYHKFLMKEPEKKLLLSKLIGNRRSLTQWSTNLESNTIILHQPWYYSRSEVNSFPLFLFEKKKLKHKYLFRDRIQDLLRMRVLLSNQNDQPIWKELQDVNLSYLEIEQDLLLPPEMIGNYIYLSQDEYDYRKDSKLNYYINDIIKVTEETPKKASDIVSLDININEPCQGIFFVSENLSSKKLYTEFTSKESNKTPFSMIKLVYGTGERIIEKDIKTLNYMESFYHFNTLSETIYKGLHGILFCYDTSSPDPDTSIVFKNLSAKVILRLKDNIQDIFKIRFYFYILRKLEMEKEEIRYSDSSFINLVSINK